MTSNSPVFHAFSQQKLDHSIKYLSKSLQFLPTLQKYLRQNLLMNEEREGETNLSSVCNALIIQPDQG
jgi:hypothetical protein